MKPPEWPEPWWIPQLEKFVAGGGCVPEPPPQSHCPHDQGWTPCAGSGCTREGCCTMKYADVDLSKCSTTDHEACAKQQCLASDTEVNVWVPLDYKHHPYTCCPPPANA